MPKWSSSLADVLRSKDIVDREPICSLPKIADTGIPSLCTVCFPNYTTLYIIIMSPGWNRITGPLKLSASEGVSSSKTSLIGKLSGLQRKVATRSSSAPCAWRAILFFGIRDWWTIKRKLRYCATTGCESFGPVTNIPGRNTSNTKSVTGKT